MQSPLMVFASLLLLAGPQTTSPPGNEVLVTHCVVAALDDVEVPAQEAGVLLAKIPVLDGDGKQVVDNGQPQYQPFRVREGMQVTEGQLLTILDDADAWKSWEAAAARLEAARAEAGNDISVQAAEAAAQVAEAEYYQALDANRRAPNTVPQAELRRMLLQHRQLLLQKKQAEHDLDLAKLSVHIRQAEEAAALLAVDRRYIRAPFDGIVVELYRNFGEWFQPGQPVLRVVRMDRMRIKGFLEVTEALPAELAGQPVTVVLDTRQLPQHARSEAGAVFRGQVSFVSPIVEEGRFAVWAEVDNRQEHGHWVLRDGLTAEMRIQRKQLAPLARIAP